ncbi:MAG: hypothetical protein IJP89_07040 [Synergistaceae bacterium]|nr:hypothetical protein [Synergistaceae bacterium]MBR0151100.1 hypothetical protein [Synergistaceae bacterium]
MKFAVMFGIALAVAGVVYVAVSYLGGAFLVGFAAASVMWGAVWYMSLRSRKPEDKILSLIQFLRDRSKHKEQDSVPATVLHQENVASNSQQKELGERPSADNLREAEEIVDAVKDIGKKAVKKVGQRIINRLSR